MRRWTALLQASLAWMLVAGCAMTPRQIEHGAEAGGLRDYVTVIAHRGASADAPENTLAAFEESIRQGADYFELDCHLSKDGAVIVIHDATVDRTTDGAGRVRDMTFEELRQLDAGAWRGEAFAGERLPTLDEALSLARGRIGVYVELKSVDDDGPIIAAFMQAMHTSPALTGPVRAGLLDAIAESGNRNLELTRAAIDSIRAHGMTDTAVIQSFSPVICFVALTEAPEIRTEFLGWDDPDRPEVFPGYVALADYFDVPGMNVHQEALTPERLEAFQAAGRSVAVWTVNDRDAMARFARMGVDAIITDYPGVCAEVLAELPLAGNGG